MERFMLWVSFLKKCVAHLPDCQLSVGLAAKACWGKKQNRPTILNGQTCFVRVSFETGNSLMSVPKSLNFNRDHQRRPSKIKAVLLVSV